MAHLLFLLVAGMSHLSFHISHLSQKQHPTACDLNSHEASLSLNLVYLPKSWKAGVDANCCNSHNIARYDSR